MNPTSELALGFQRWKIGAFPVRYRSDNSYIFLLIEFLSGNF